MSMMKKFNNLFVNEDDFGDEIVEKNSASIEKQKIKNVKKEVPVSKTMETAVPQAKTNNVILTEPLVFADSKDIIDDIKFLGTGCSISMASASMLTEELKGLSVQKANEKIHDFLNMIMGTEFNEENLEDSIALQNISQLPARVKCATLAWKITEKILEDSKK